MLKLSDLVIRASYKSLVQGKITNQKPHPRARKSLQKPGGVPFSVMPALYEGPLQGDETGQDRSLNGFKNIDDLALKQNMYT